MTSVAIGRGCDYLGYLDNFPVDDPWFPKGKKYIEKRLDEAHGVVHRYATYAQDESVSLSNRSLWEYHARSTALFIRRVHLRQINQRIENRGRR